MIEFRGVHHSYGDREVLRGIDLVLDGPRTGIIGANGSGKSTLARMINGLVEPASGQVLVDGLDVSRHGREVRRRVAFVFPDPEAQIVMPTVSEDIAFSLRRRRLTREAVDARIDAALARFGLADHRDHPAHLLSSGQKQLLALASVTAVEPAILVADEPTTMLDRRHTRTVMRHLEALDQQLVLVSHQLELFASWERVVVVDEGRVVADGPGVESIDFYRRLMDGETTEGGGGGASAVRHPDGGTSGPGRTDGTGPRC
ncbi:energy-coupling factor ABC transporter ATP-binding protein [Mobilicoccus pelagius]|uniref:Putative ABC transporter ATP-binding protein n=1 Tax=Mobilicoccus pelagius NBRC 104925 TaxID=1089455 RepID=H5UQ95_9MICO|nr:ABC transporter ATP-binding protein [Mobilicoccus pelagius]GAB47903.1 putative ABC transporter ATP-binding protein [Mobilicoccus pelagius NBRC 104925]